MRMSRLAVGFAGLLLAPFTTGAAEVISGPTLTMNPNGNTPLAGVLELETDVPVRVVLTVSEGGDAHQIGFPDAAQQHHLPVLGLKPEEDTAPDPFETISNLNLALSLFHNLNSFS